jgi:hypothetical protein
LKGKARENEKGYKKSTLSRPLEQHEASIRLGEEAAIGGAALGERQVGRGSELPRGTSSKTPILRANCCIYCLQAVFCAEALCLRVRQARF